MVVVVGGWKTKFSVQLSLKLNNLEQAHKYIHEGVCRIAPQLKIFYGESWNLQFFTVCCLGWTFWAHLYHRGPQCSVDGYLVGGCRCYSGLGF